METRKGQYRIGVTSLVVAGESSLSGGEKVVEEMNEPKDDVTCGLCGELKVAEIICWMRAEASGMKGKDQNR